MIVTIPNPIRPDIDVTTFADITPVVVTSIAWGDVGLNITFASDITPAQQARVGLRCLTRNAAAEALYVAGYNALGSNDDFLALSAPTNAQTLAQVKALTRQASGLIRERLSTVVVS